MTWRWTRWSTRFARAAAFSMTETLIALGIFAIGFAAVASIFPVAAILQKETAGDVLAQQVARNVQAMMQARPYKHADLDANQPHDLDVHQPYPLPMSTSPVFNFWKLGDRSYFYLHPTSPPPPGYYAHENPPNSGTFTAVGNDAFHRGCYWVPLFRRRVDPTGPMDWQVLVFVLHREDSKYDRGAASTWQTEWADAVEGYVSPNWLIPGVRWISVTAVMPNRFTFTNAWGSGLEIAAGDQILDNNGFIYVVQQADTGGVNVAGRITQITGQPTDTLWYGRPAAAGRSTPTRKILVLSNVVE